MVAPAFPASWSTVSDCPHPNLLDSHEEYIPQGYPVPSNNCLPNFSSWFPGDIILFCPKQPSPIQQLIETAQLKAVASIYASLHACWTHVAIYMGKGLICDATVSGGSSQYPVSNLLNEGSIRVRRLGAISDQERIDLANNAISQIGIPYSRLKAFLAGIAPQAPAPIRQLLQQFPALENETFCSEFVNQRYIDVTNTSFRTQAIPCALPCSFSYTGLLTEVQIGWRRARHLPIGP